MHDRCFVNLPRSAAARLRKVSLQLPHLSGFSLIKRVFRDALISLKREDVNSLFFIFQKKLTDLKFEIYLCEQLIKFAGAGCAVLYILSKHKLTIKKFPQVNNSTIFKNI